MPIKNYTTGIAEEKTIGEIMTLLSSKGARAIRVDYDARNRPDSIQFIIALNGAPIPFKLPCNFEGVFRAMANQFVNGAARRRFERNPSNEIQARRTAWRIIKDWVAAQMALVEAEQATLAQVFLPYAVVNDGRTMYEAFVDQKALPAPSQELTA